MEVSPPASPVAAAAAAEEPVMVGAEETLFRFDAARAGSMVDGKQWDDLLLYLDAFLAMNPHGGTVHPHPDLRFVVIERKVLDLVEANQYDEALAVFESQAAPLLSHEDKLFFPLDLPDRLHLLKSHVLKGTVPEASADVRTAIEDYIYLYFSNTNRPSSQKWGGTIREFFHFHPERNLYRCRACGWLVPDGCAEGHIRHNGGQKLCSRMTMYLRDRVNIYDKKAAAEPHDFAAFASRYTLKSNKRKESSDSCGRPTARKGKLPKSDSNVSVETMMSSNVSVEVVKGDASNVSVEVIKGETMLSVSKKLLDCCFCFCIHELFWREDSETEVIRRLVKEQFERATELNCKLLDVDDVITVDDITKLVKKMMDVNLDKLLPLLKLFPIALYKFREFDAMLYKLRWMCIGRAAAEGTGSDSSRAA